ncbi:hypothetical protein C1T17_15105 [Sphingobium sp. SCG-1]|uniref:DUF6127 family protein n=1 Tax=Sphingobium sp. SCG-1 TaxID=2072936 RepID=UPI000CD67C10|nr:DUF6127 family protein [Sphingobium sp. SCG-1]AUW59219.1 hypothetical protein C1T17_15105 [Sphingobium sp. SCG-1]
MENTEMLTRLVAQADAEGGDLVMIRALVEEASEAGAGRALARVGLGDRGAEKDVEELRAMLKGWRAAKKTAWSAAIGWTVRGCLALVLIGVAVKLGLLALVSA